MDIRVGRRFKLIHKAPRMGGEVGEVFTVMQVKEEGLVCKTDRDRPAFIPTNCMFPVTETATGFQINHHSEARALAAYEFLD